MLARSHPELIEQSQLTGLAELDEHRLGGAATHGGEGVEGAAREAGERLAEQELHVLGNVGEAEFLARPLHLGELRRELDARRPVHPHREAQEDRRVAGIAQIHHADLLGPVQLQILKARHRARGDVRHRLAIRAGHDQILLEVVVQSAG
jgi:hypothetical protein